MNQKQQIKTANQILPGKIPELQKGDKPHYVIKDKQQFKAGSLGGS